MTDDLIVLMDEVEVGLLIRDARGRVRFAYNPRYPATATSLSLSIPQERTACMTRVPGWRDWSPTTSRCCKDGRCG